MIVRELAKPEGTWCAHCTPGRGCGIYERRPETCDAFSCQWLLNPYLPEALRPDRSKVIFDTDDSRRLIVRCDPADPLAWRRPDVYPALKGFARRVWGAGRQAIAMVDRNIWIITPTDAQPDVDLGWVDPDSPLFAVARPDGWIDVEVLPPGARVV
jgi:hypothetical protein